jgi:DNA polymerase-3 subunit alpha
VRTFVPRIARELRIPMVVTNDCHYIRKEHALPHNVLLHIRDVGSGKGQPIDITKLRYGQPEMYFKTGAQMLELFPDYPDAVERTLEIAEKCTLELRPQLHLPQFPIPEDSGARTLEEYLRQLVERGLAERYGVPIPEEVRRRAEYELEVITRMGFAGYFLIVQDFIAAARRMGVRVGPGRGSAVGSLVAYALGITSLDPLRYDLLFERFLNPERVSMPDIDVDFSDDKRDLVIDYVRRRYGESSVAQIITFGRSPAVPSSRMWGVCWASQCPRSTPSRSASQLCWARSRPWRRRCSFPTCSGCARAPTRSCASWWSSRWCWRASAAISRSMPPAW